MPDPTDMVLREVRDRMVMILGRGSRNLTNELSYARDKLNGLIDVAKKPNAPSDLAEQAQQEHYKHEDAVVNLVGKKWVEHLSDDELSEFHDDAKQAHEAAKLELARRAS